MPIEKPPPDRRVQGFQIFKKYITAAKYDVSTDTTSVFLKKSTPRVSDDDASELFRLGWVTDPGSRRMIWRYKNPDPPLVPRRRLPDAKPSA